MDVNEWGLAQSAVATSASPGPTAPVQWGQGESYQSTCPPFLPPPPGYVAWNVNVNGSIPADVETQAVALSKDMTKAVGYTETIYSGGIPLILRVDAHTWTTDASGDAVAGCYHGVDVWVPSPSVNPPTQATAAGQSASNTLLVISIGLGAIVSALSIVEFFRSR